jgi:hypothetical protein
MASNYILQGLRLKTFSCSAIQDIPCSYMKYKGSLPYLQEPFESSPQSHFLSMSKSSSWYRPFMFFE